MSSQKRSEQQNQPEMSYQIRTQQQNQHQDKNKEMARSKDQGLHTKCEDDPDNE